MSGSPSGLPATPEEGKVERGQRIGRAARRRGRRPARGRATGFVSRVEARSVPAQERVGPGRGSDPQAGLSACSAARRAGRTRLMTSSRSRPILKSIWPPLCVLDFQARPVKDVVRGGRRRTGCAPRTMRGRSGRPVRADVRLDHVPSRTSDPAVAVEVHPHVVASATFVP